MKNATQRIALRRIASLLAIPVLASALLGASGLRDNDPVITVNSNSRDVPSELNPPFVNKRPVVPRTTPGRQRPSRGKSSSPSTGQPRNSRERRANATRHPPRAILATRRALGQRSGRRSAAKSRSFLASAARPDTRPRPKPHLGMTRCRSTITTKLSPPAIRRNRMIRYPGSTLMRPIRSPLTTCMRAMLRALHRTTAPHI
jgi:hypothetical protein